MAMLEELEKEELKIASGFLRAGCMGKGKTMWTGNVKGENRKKNYKNRERINFSGLRVHIVAFSGFRFTHLVSCRNNAGSLTQVFGGTIYNAFYTLIHGTS